MFGYVRPLQEKLSKQQRETYQQVYCGLCHAIGKRYGFLPRFTLTYDFTFLAMLLVEEERPVVCKKRCPAHPVSLKNGCAYFSGLDIAADESMILTWYKLKDDWEDKVFWKGLPARFLALFFKRAYRKAASLQPQFDQQVRSALKELRQLEIEQSSSIDRVADTFARILEIAAPKTNHSARDRVRGQILYHVGRWIYLADAWDDRLEDRKQGSYNPLDLRFCGKPEEHLEELRITMIHSLNMAISAFQLDDFGVFDDIIENILCLGLPVVQDMVLSDRWREMQKNREKNNE